MPMRFKHGPPHELMREWLQAARDAGQDFDTAWAAALRCPSQGHIGIRLPHQTSERTAWLAVFEATKEEWRAGFERRETGVSRALAHWREHVADDFSGAAWHAALAGKHEERPQLASVPMPHYVRGDEARRHSLARAAA